MDPALAEFIAALPKVELHLHLEGSMTPQVGLQLAARRGVELPGANEGVAGLQRAFTFTSFGDFLQLYIALSKCLQQVQDVRDIVVDLGRRLAEQNVRYAEVTFTPMTHVARGVATDTLHAGLSEGRVEVQSSFGVKLCWVFDVVRSCPDQAGPTVDFAIEHQRRAPGTVVGMGVGGPEAGTFDMDPIARMFARGRAEGLHSVPHAGEMAGPDSIWTAVRDLGAERLGHGVRCLEDPELVAHLVQEGIALEVCPTSNLCLKVVETLSAHPLPDLMAAGLRISLGSDDPPLFNTDLLTEYLRCAETFAWDAPTIRAVAAGAVEQSFLAESDKQRLLAAQRALPTPRTGEGPWR